MSHKTPTYYIDVMKVSGCSHITAIAWNGKMFKANDANLAKVVSKLNENFNGEAEIIKANLVHNLSSQVVAEYPA